MQGWNMHPGQTQQSDAIQDRTTERQMPILASGDTTLKISTSSLKMTKLSDPGDRQEKTWKKRWIFLFLARLSRDGGFETSRPRLRDGKPLHFTLHSLGQAHKLPQLPVPG